MWCEIIGKMHTKIYDRDKERRGKRTDDRSRLVIVLTQNGQSNNISIKMKMSWT